MSGLGYEIEVKTTNVWEVAGLNPGRRAPVQALLRAGYCSCDRWWRLRRSAYVW